MMVDQQHAELEGKACPLLSMGKNHIEACRETMCAWWVKAIASACGHCIMQELGHLGDISDEIYNRTKGE